MFHVGGLNIQTVPAFHAGATIVLHAKFDPVAVFEDLEREEITLCILVPAQIMAMIQMPQWPKLDLSHLRMLSTGSTLVPHSLIRAFHERGIPVTQVYGSTETAPIATHGSVAMAEGKVGSGGMAALHCEIKIIDEDGAEVAAGTSGEILVRGPNIMREYWQAPELTAEALKEGWFHSGDIGHLDEDGFLFVDDRKKDMIISGAENIYPAELENLLADCAELEEAAVVGRADEKWGEVPVAVAVRKTGARIDEDGVKEFFKDRIARFKHPHDVIFIEALPRNAMGKVVKDELRELVAKGEKN
jgi:fatty-acyl-CoA synthase